MHHASNASPSKPLDTKAAARPPLTGTALLEFYQRGVVREHGFEPLEVEGRLPPSLRGTLYRNGPGLAELHGRPYEHLFEADGAISAVRFDGNGGVHGAVRVTESRELCEERAAGRHLYGSHTSWARRVSNSFRGRIKNTANTSLLSYQDKLYALMEAARPTEIDPETLAVIGESDFSGVLGSAFSAHPHRVPSRKATYNFGLQYGRNNAIVLYELPDVGTPRRIGSVPLSFGPMLHDFIATERHLIFFLSPVSVRVMRVLSGIGGFGDMFAWKPERGTEVIVVPIDSPQTHHRFRVDAFFQWHFANAFELGGGKIAVDFVRYDNFDSFSGIVTGRDFAPGVLCRAVVDCEREELTTSEILEGGCEFPQIHPRLGGARHRYVWTMTEDDRGIVALDTEDGTTDSFDFGGNRLTSEPLFVPSRAAPDDDERAGHILAMSYDRDQARAFVAVFDAARIADGPCARVWFDDLLPQTFHGIWREPTEPR